MSLESPSSAAVRLAEIKNHLQRLGLQLGGVQDLPTLADWMTCADPWPRQELFRCFASERRCRLFAVACCRGLWHLLADERSRQAIEIAERYADGEAKLDELRDARIAAFYALREHKTQAHRAVHFAVADDALMAATQASWCASSAGVNEAQSIWLLDIFGGPPVLAHSIGGAQAWVGGIAGQVARAIYDERALRRRPCWPTPWKRRDAPTRRSLPTCAGQQSM
jgi:hypothetical protein